MKFLCVPCDQPMRLTKPPAADRGSLSIVYACDECGYEMAMLTNAYETQVVQSLGVRIGPSQAGAATAAACPFAEKAKAAVAGAPASMDASAVGWTEIAEARLQSIPAFVRPMARTGIETFARERGYPQVDERVMDEAREHFGM
jgi:Proto-chlorophyllide reductase 57 kD subunit